MASPISLFAHGIPLTPETATGKGWLCAGLAILLALMALIALLCKRRGSATRLLGGSGFCGLLALCLFATAETLRRGFGLSAVRGGLYCVHSLRYSRRMRGGLYVSQRKRQPC